MQRTKLQKVQFLKQYFNKSAIFRIHRPIHLLNYSALAHAVIIISHQTLVVRSIQIWTETCCHSCYSTL